MAESKNTNAVVENTEAVEEKVSLKEKVQQFSDKHAKAIKVVKIVGVAAAAGVAGFFTGKKAGIKASTVQDICEEVVEEAGDLIQ